MAITVTQVEFGEVQALEVESLMQLTRSVAKVKVVLAKVKWVVAHVTIIGEGGAARPSTTQEGVPTPSKIYLLEVDRCFRFLDDSIPLEVKEEVLERPIGEGLQ